jgi:hypothetical protein
MAPGRRIDEKILVLAQDHLGRAEPPASRTLVSSIFEAPTCKSIGTVALPEVDGRNLQKEGTLAGDCKPPGKPPSSLVASVLQGHKPNSAGNKSGARAAAPGSPYLKVSNDVTGTVR